MKLAITYLLLFTYSTIMLKPLLPYTSDIIAHVFWYSDHIATVHSHNGKFHVHKEIMEASKNNNPEKNSNILKKDASPNEHLANKNWKPSLKSHLIKKYFCQTSSLLLNISLKADYPPPKV